MWKAKRTPSFNSCSHWIQQRIRPTAAPSAVLNSPIHILLSVNPSRRDYVTHTFKRSSFFGHMHNFYLTFKAIISSMRSKCKSRCHVSLWSQKEIAVKTAYSLFLQRVRWDRYYLYIHYKVRACRQLSYLSINTVNRGKKLASSYQHH